MFDKAIIDMDKFMDLPMSSKALYFLLGMEADDEGFVSYKKILRIHGGNEDDIKVLIGKEFLIVFPSGVVVITDWNKNNYLDKNRLRPTEYQTEKSQLILNHKKEYCLTDVKPMFNQYSIEESSIEEKRIEEKRVINKFVKPNLEEVKEYCESRKNNIDAESFIAFYESKGWKVGNQPMKDWKSAVITWEKRNNNKFDRKQTVVDRI